MVRLLLFERENARSKDRDRDYPIFSHRSGRASTECACAVLELMTYITQRDGLALQRCFVGEATYLLRLRWMGPRLVRVWRI